MTRGFGSLVGAQFLSALADNAVLAIPDTGRRCTRRPAGPTDLVRSFTVAFARAFSILPLGLLFGPLLIALLPVTSVPVAYALLLLGTAAGAFLVPMNAMLQHRGSAPTNVGQAIAVQNLCENLGVMTMVAMYAALLGRVPLDAVVVGLGLAVSLALLALLRHALNHLRSAGSAGAAESNP